jgi:glycosyltransferase involved in cell wall biosynthesis
VLPKVSIITVVYNNRAFVQEAIRSVLSQTYKNVEYIVIDGGSTDGTVECIKEHAAGITYFISEKDKGIYDAMNKGIRLATGEIVGILNSDDVYAHDRVLEMVVDVMKNAEIDACYGDLVYVNKDMSRAVRLWRSCSYRKGLFSRGWTPPHPAFFVRRPVYEKYGVFDLNYVLAADFELLFRFLEKHQVCSVYVPGVFVKMRLGGATNKDIKNIVRQNREILHVLHSAGADASPVFFVSKIFEKVSQFVAARFYTL